MNTNTTTASASINAVEEQGIIADAVEWTTDLVSEVATSTLDTLTTVGERVHADIAERMADIKDNWKSDVNQLRALKRADLAARRARMLKR